MPVRDDSETSRLHQEATIREMIHKKEPCAMGKIGTTELLGLEYLYRWIQPSWPKTASWRRPAKRLYECSGLFPIRHDIFFRWADECRLSLGQLDLASQWQVGPAYETALESALIDRLCPRAVRVGYYFLRILNPRAPWLDDLAKLRWLVIHPFEKTIRAQLPHLAELGVYSESARGDLAHRARDTAILACPQLPYMVPPRHRDWFEALEDLKSRMEKIEFREALEQLAERAGIDLPRGRGGVPVDERKSLNKVLTWACDRFSDHLRRSADAEPARAYLRDRGLSLETIERFHLGSAPEAWDWSAAGTTTVSATG